jgi:hypothetical protein
MFRVVLKPHYFAPNREGVVDGFITGARRRTETFAVPVSQQSSSRTGRERSCRKASGRRNPCRITCLRVNGEQLVDTRNHLRGDTIVRIQLHRFNEPALGLRFARSNVRRAEAPMNMVKADTLRDALGNPSIACLGCQPG